MRIMKERNRSALAPTCWLPARILSYSNGFVRRNSRWAELAGSVGGGEKNDYLAPIRNGRLTIRTASVIPSLSLSRFFPFLSSSSPPPFYDPTRCLPWAFVFLDKSYNFHRCGWITDSVELTKTWLVVYLVPSVCIYIHIYIQACKLTLENHCAY